jgi:hypothetical protein
LRISTVRAHGGTHSLATDALVDYDQMRFILSIEHHQRLGLLRRPPTLSELLSRVPLCLCDGNGRCLSLQSK